LSCQPVAEVISSLQTVVSEVSSLNEYIRSGVKRFDLELSFCECIAGKLDFMRYGYLSLSSILCMVFAHIWHLQATQVKLFHPPIAGFQE
jgi:menaquinone-dependent protoporphyrinogen IX oxidase